MIDPSVAMILIALAILIPIWVTKRKSNRQLLRVVHPLTGEFLTATYDPMEAAQARERALFAECEKWSAYAQELELRIVALRTPPPTLEETAKPMERREAEARAKAMNEDMRRQFGAF